MRTPGTSLVRLSVKKLVSGAVLPTSVPVTNQASCEIRAPAQKASRSFFRQFQMPSRKFSNSLPSANFRHNPHGQQNKAAKFKAPSKEECVEAKKQVIQKMAEILAVQSSEAAGPKYTVSVEILDKTFSMLIDSGSQVNIIPAEQCPREILTCLSPPSLSISAYNGSAVQILGSFKTDVRIGPICIRETLMHVTQNNFRPILGTPALKNLTLNFKDGSICNGDLQVRMNARDFQLSAANFNLQVSTSKEPRKQFRLFSSTTTTIPARHEAVVPVRIENSFSGYGLFMTDPAKPIIAGCTIAKSLSCFTKTSRNGVIRVLNPSSSPIEIKHRSPLVNVVAVDAIAPNPTNRCENVVENVKIGTVPESAQLDIKKLLEEFSDIFASESTPLGQTQNVEFDIDTGSSPPVAQQKYRTPYFLRSEMRNIIDKNVQNGLMEPCSSPWAAPTLLVRKSNGKWRLVCDYRRLNNVTTADSYPLPEISDCVNELSESKYFTTTDLYSGFHQIPTTKQAQQKLAVITDFGQYTWLRMPMGAKNCPAVFQRMMDSAFRSMPLSTLVIYLDDILLHSKSLDDHLKKLEEMFRILRKNQLFLRADKTVIACKEVNFCGFRIKNGIKYPNPEKVKAVREIANPTSSKEAQSVFGLLNYFRAFIPSFAKKAAAITNCYKKKTHFEWPTEAENALKTLKDEICDATLQLRIPCIKNAKFVLETDACDKGYAGVLFICRKTEDHETHGSGCLRPVEFMSGQFTESQRKYYIAEKELFAGREAMRKWSHYLLSRPFNWHIDNSCLKWAHRNQSTKPRISGWLAEIANYDAKTVLKPSSQMKVSDCLSRQFTEINAIRLTRLEIQLLQENDPVLKQVRNHAANNRWPNHPSSPVKFYCDKRDSLEFGRSGELHIRDGNQIKLALPYAIIQEVISTYHDDVGHPGTEKTIADIANRYIWPALQEDVTKFIKTCHECQISKPNLRPKQPTLGESETPTGPFQVLAFDLIGPMPVTDNENRYALVGLDLFSKRISAVALQSKNGDIVQNEIERIVFANPFLPHCILTDNGTEFANVETFCAEFGIKNSKSAPYHPQTNGAVERANQTLKQRLFDVDGEQTWDTRLNRIVHAINMSPNHVTKFTPFQVETGFYGRNAFDRVEQISNQPDDVRQLQEETLQRIDHEKTTRVQKHAKPDFKPFCAGDLVVIKNHQNKWPRYIGPFQIIKVKGSGLSYDLSEVDGNRRFTRAVADLKPYYSRSQESTSPPVNRTQPGSSPAKNEEALSALDDDSSQTNSRRSATSVLLSDFFNFENFPPLTRSQQVPVNPQNSPVPSAITPPTTESEPEPALGETSDTSSSTSVESVIYRSPTAADNSTRSIIELDTMDDWTWNSNAQSTDKPDPAIAQPIMHSNPTVSTEPANSSTESSTSSTESSSPTPSQSTSSIESSTSPTDSLSQSPAHSNSNASETASSGSSVADVPQAEMIPQRKQRVRACKFFKKDRLQGTTKKIDYKE